VGCFRNQVRSEGIYLCDAGTSAVALLNDLKNNAPEIYARLAI
jgi:hypothetical protein